MIFFDVGGTLVEQSVDAAAATLTALEAVAGPAGAAARRALAAMAHTYASGVYAPSSLEGEAAFWQAVAGAGLSCLPGGATASRVVALAATLGDYAGWYRPVAGMPEILADLRRVGRRVGIISNWPPSLADFLQRTGFGSFPVLACSGPLRSAKPDPGIFRWALERAGVGAGECLYVGNDREVDYLPAAALGMRTILWDPEGSWVGRDLRRAGSARELRLLLGLD